MNPEPLKGKWKCNSPHMIFMIYGKNMDKEKLCDQETYELWMDIKSAVEWLKQEDEELYVLFSNGKIKFHELIRRLKDNRYEAFEDVMKK